MGKIKLKMIKRSAVEMKKQGVKFEPDFKKNKKILGDTMPSKKLRNQMAGYMERLAKRKE
jgi:ribosomal protein S17E